MSTPSNPAAETELERLRRENAALTALRMKVSEKGALSVYGLGRFPVTLYREQWVRLLAAKEEILTFADKNSNLLRTKS